MPELDQKIAEHLDETVPKDFAAWRALQLATKKERAATKAAAKAAAANAKAKADPGKTDSSSSSAPPVSPIGRPAGCGAEEGEAPAERRLTPCAWCKEPNPAPDMLLEGNDWQGDMPLRCYECAKGEFDGSMQGFADEV